MEEIKNIFIIEKVLNECLPSSSKRTIEPYSELFEDLKKYKLFLSDELRLLIRKHKTTILKMDQERVSEIQKDLNLSQQNISKENLERLESGSFYGHVRLAQEALKLEFEQEYLLLR